MADEILDKTACDALEDADLADAAGGRIALNLTAANVSCASVVDVKLAGVKPDHLDISRAFLSETDKVADVNLASVRSDLM